MKTNGKDGLSRHLDFVAIDLLCLAAAFVASYWLKFRDFGLFSSPSWTKLFVILLLVNLVVMLAADPYSGIFRRRYYEDVRRNLLLAVCSFVAACIVFYLFKVGTLFSREMLVVTYVLYVVLSLVLKFLRKRSVWSRRQRPAEAKLRDMLVVTGAGRVAEVAEMVEAGDFREYDIVAYAFDGEQDEGFDEVPGDAAVVPFGQIAGYAAHNNIDDVFVDIDPGRIDPQVYAELVEDGVVVHVSIERMLGVQTDSQSVGSVGVYRTLGVGRFSFGAGQTAYLVVKRAFDIALGAVGCVLTVPLVAVVKLCYLATGDRHPVFYVQKRVGMRGRQFDLHKLRTMVWNADEVLVELLEDEGRRKEWELNQKFENDPRITRVGRFLRRTSLDEFPQFWNVLRGDMSVVGPRPLVPGELESHDGRTLYNKVRPGVTGWWACNGRSNINYRERLELEYYYVRHCSLYLDAACVFRTAVAVVKKEGAQ